MYDPEITRRHLDSRNRSLRLAALFLVYTHWLDRPMFVSRCMEIAFHDADEVSRGLAIHCLSRLYKHIDDPSGTVKSLLSVVLPVDESVRLLANKGVAICERGLRRVQERIQEECRRLVGKELDKMMLSREETERYLTHSSPDLRYVALRLLAVHWKSGKVASEAAQQILFDKTLASRLRVTAMQVLGTVYRNTNDRRIGELFGQIVLDDAEDPALRRQAYFGLHFLRGTPLLTRPDRRFTFPDDADWGFVRSFLDT